MDPVVIVGAGMAAHALARELRRRDGAAELLLVTGDAGDAYAKPLLSNAIAAGRTPERLVSASAAQMAEALGARVLAHTPVLAIDRAARTLETAAGPLRYGRLVLAVGAAPVRLPLAGDAAGEVLALNHLDDYAALRRRLAAAGAGARVAVVGAGLVGCELADDLLAGGYRVALVDPQAQPLAALAPPVLAQALLEAWRGRALDLRLRRAVRAVHRGGAGAALELELDDGERLAADVVVAAVGLRPATALAAAAGLPTARGIVVDRHGRTGDPAIYALGDCAEYAAGAGGQGDRHQGGVLPYLAPMLVAARAIAATLCGVPTPIVLGPEPVLVKTPSCRLALLPPPPGTAGAWRSAAADGRIVARFHDARGVLRGFGLTDPAAGPYRALLAEVEAAAH